MGNVREPGMRMSNKMRAFNPACDAMSFADLRQAASRIRGGGLTADDVARAATAMRMAWATVYSDPKSITECEGVVEEARFSMLVFDELAKRNC